LTYVGWCAAFCPLLWSAIFDRHAKCLRHLVKFFVAYVR
jgi:hypothetical protein